MAESAYHHPAWTSSILPESITETGGPNPELKLQVDQATGAAHTYAGQTADPQHDPHQLTSLTGGGTFGYDDAGNTTQRTLAGVTQTFDWDAEARLEKVSDSTGGSPGTELARHIYGPGGERLLKRDPTGTTLYLGDTEITLNTTGTATSWQRHYTFDGQTVAVRYGNKMTDTDILIADPQNTAQHAIKTNDSQITSRRTLPFGAVRKTDGTIGTDPAGWKSQRGFVGGVSEAATGLIRVGARDYDNSLGRFLSLDPILDPLDPQTTGGYGYAGNNPITYSDPTGLAPCGVSCDSLLYDNDSGFEYIPAGNAPVGQSERTGLRETPTRDRPTDGGTAVVRWLGGFGRDAGVSALAGGTQLFDDVWNGAKSAASIITSPECALPTSATSSAACRGSNNTRLAPDSDLTGELYDATDADPNSVGAWAGRAGLVLSPLKGTRGAAAVEDEVTLLISFGSKTSARNWFGGDVGIAANRFFREATGKSEGFQAQYLRDGSYRLQFFSPARNAGYGKRYVQELDSTGTVLREYKNTQGPHGLIERKWVHGGP